MRKIAKQILGKTTIVKNKDIQAAVEFVCEPDSVARMIAATKAGKPALGTTIWGLQRNAT